MLLFCCIDHQHGRLVTWFQTKKIFSEFWTAYDFDHDIYNSEVILKQETGFSKKKK